MKTTVGLINVKKTLSDRVAWYCLQKMWGHELDILGINEWEESRTPILAAHGQVLTVKNLKTLKPREHGVLYVNGPGGGTVLGLMADRFTVQGIGKVKLYDGSKVNPQPGKRDFEPTRYAMEVFFTDLALKKKRAVLLYHLPSDVERAGRYRNAHDPRARQHMNGAKVIDDWFAYHSRQGIVCNTMGDNNWHKMKFAHITEDWQRRSVPTLGKRDVDMIGASRKPTRVLDPVMCASDHNGKIVTY